MKRSRIRQTATAGALCAIVAATAGIATGAAAPSKDDEAPPKDELGLETPAPVPPPGHGTSGIAIIGGPPVHSESVVPNKAGDGFVTVTQDSGEVVSVSGSEITIKEGTEEATYETTTLDLPDDVTVYRAGENTQIGSLQFLTMPVPFPDDAKAEIGDLQTGDWVQVSQSSENSFVFVFDSQHQDLLKHGHMKFRRGLPPPPGIGELPPGVPPAPMARRGNN